MQERQKDYIVVLDGHDFANHTAPLAVKMTFKKAGKSISKYLNVARVAEMKTFNAGIEQFWGAMQDWHDLNLEAQARTPLRRTPSAQCLVRHCSIHEGMVIGSGFYSMSPVLSDAALVIVSDTDPDGFYGQKLAEKLNHTRDKVFSNSSVRMPAVLPLFAYLASSGESVLQANFVQPYSPTQITEAMKNPAFIQDARHAILYNQTPLPPLAMRPCKRATAAAMTAHR